MGEKAKKYTTISLRIENDLFGRIETHLDRLQDANPAIKLNRSAVIRMLLHERLQQVEKSKNLQLVHSA